MDKTSSKANGKAGRGFFSRWSVRGTFLLFVAASIGLHLMLAGSGVVSEKLAKARELREAQQKLQQTQAKKVEAKAVKKELSTAALAQTKADVQTDLKSKFDAVVGKDLPPDVAQEMWDKLLANLQGQLDDVAGNMGNEAMTDAQVQAQMQQMQGQMLADLLNQLRALGAKKLAASFVDRVKTDIAPKLAAHYNTQIDRQIGAALRVAGTKIIADDTATVREQRKEMRKIPGAKIDNTDPSLAARRGVRDARDDSIKGQLDASFKQEVVEKAVPKMSDQLTDAFKKTLDDAGLKDDATVADVRKKLAAALGDTVQKDVNAGDTGTKQLTRAGRLDQAGNGPAGTGDNGKQLAGAGKQGPGKAGTASQGTGAATQMADAGKADDKKLADKKGEAAPGDADEAAVAAKMAAAAKGIAGKGMGELAGDAGAAKIVAGAIRGTGKGDAAGVNGIETLANRVARLSSLLNGTDADAGGADGAGQGGGPGGPLGSGSGGFGRMRQNAFARSRGANLIRDDYIEYDRKQYEEMTAGIHARNAAAAEGQKITLIGTTGDAATDIDAMVEQSKSTPQAAEIVAPSDTTKDAPIGIPEKKAPYKPAFANIAFASIPYRTKPIVIDGDLSEWADVPTLEMTPVHPRTTTSAASPATEAPPLKIQVQWDSTGFYVAYHVKKMTPGITKVTPDIFWEGDGAEIWIDPLNTKPTVRTELTQQFWAWVAGEKNDPSIVGGEAVSYNRHYERNGFTKDQMQVASRKTADGWDMEVHLPKERIHDIQMQPGRIVGMNFSICTGSPVYYYWAGTAKQGTFGAPDTWGDVLLAGSDAKLECVDRLTSELKQTETAKPISYLRIGEPLRIRVTSTVMNLSDAVRDKISVSVASHHGGRQEVILEETGKATGIFEGAIPTTLETGDPVINTLSLYEGERIDITYNDQCRADGSRNVKVKLSLPTASSVGKIALK